MKSVARPVSHSTETGPPFFHDLLPDEPLDKPVRIVDIRKELRSPFAGRRNQTTPQFLEYAAYYVAGVMCEQAGHLHPPEEWPCRTALDFAYTQIHLLAAQKLPQPKQEKRDAKSVEVPQGSGKGSGKSSGGQSGRESGGKQRRGRTTQHVRRKR